jgi:hypothetical protein
LAETKFSFCLFTKRGRIEFLPDDFQRIPTSQALFFWEIISIGTGELKRGYQTHIHMTEMGI